jgi:hypothetical protein
MNVARLPEGDLRRPFFGFETRHRRLTSCIAKNLGSAYQILSWF